MDLFPGGETRNLWSGTRSFAEPTALAYFARLDEYAGSFGLEAVAGERAAQCVAGPRYITRPYDLSRDGVVIDVTTSLIWQRCPYGRLDDPDCTDDFMELDWVDLTRAYDYCENLLLAGRDDWRLPNVHEIISLFSRIGMAASVEDRAAFPETAILPYWSSTSGEGTQALVATPTTGTVAPVSHLDEYRIRCVTDL